MTGDDHRMVTRRAGATDAERWTLDAKFLRDRRQRDTGATQQTHARTWRVFLDRHDRYVLTKPNFDQVDSLSC